MNSTARQYRAHDAPDDTGIVTLPAWLALLTVFALALLGWAVIWFAMAWTIGVLQG